MPLDYIIYKIYTFNLRTPICKVSCNKFTWIRIVTFLNTSRNEQAEDFCSFMEGFDWYGSWKKADILLFLYCTNMASFHNHLWVDFKPWPMFFWYRRFLWETNFKFWNYRSDLIKSETNIFNIFSLVDLPYECTDLDLGFSTWILMAVDFIKRALICARFFSIDSYDPRNSFSLCWKLMNGWWIWYCISDIRDCKIFIIQ